MSPENGLARIWRMLVQRLDTPGDWRALSRCVIWMPSHGSRESIGIEERSDGQVVSRVDWRANRLADAHAKLAVAPYLLAEDTITMIKQRRCLVEKVLVRIGRVTAAANHFFEEVVVDGVVKRVIRRDTLPPPNPSPSLGLSMPTFGICRRLIAL